MSRVETQSLSLVFEPGKPRFFDLFSGTGSVSQAFLERGYEVISLDIAPHFKPTIVADILSWDYKSQFRPGHFDTIFCSPPCNQFSIAKTTAPRDLEQADLLVKKSLEIIKYFCPRKGFLENPRTGLLTKRPYMEGIPFVDVDYFQFSQWRYQKPTRIREDPSISHLTSKICDRKTCINLVDRPNGRKGHREISGGNQMRATRNDKYRIPEDLLKYLCDWPDRKQYDAAVDYIKALYLDALPNLEKN